MKWIVRTRFGISIIEADTEQEAKVKAVQKLLAYADVNVSLASDSDVQWIESLWK